MTTTTKDAALIAALTPSMILGKPVVPAIPDARGGHLSMWCPYCKHWHSHGRTPGVPGSGDGHRSAHCSNPASLYWETGYHLKEVDATEAQVKRLALGLPLKQSAERRISDKDQVKEFLACWTAEPVTPYDSASDLQLYMRYIGWCITTGTVALKKMAFRAWLRALGHRTWPKRGRSSFSELYDAQWRTLMVRNEPAYPATTSEGDTKHG